MHLLLEGRVWHSVASHAPMGAMRCCHPRQSFTLQSSSKVKGDSQSFHSDSLQVGRAVALQVQCRQCKSNPMVITWPCWLDAAS